MHSSAEGVDKIPIEHKFNIYILLCQEIFRVRGRLQEDIKNDRLKLHLIGKYRVIFEKEAVSIFKVKS